MQNAYSHRQNMPVFAWYDKHYFAILFIAVYAICLVFKSLGLVSQTIISKRADFKGMTKINISAMLIANVVVSYGCLFMVS